MMLSLILPLLIGTATATIYGNFEFTYCVADQRELLDSLAIIHKPSPNNGPATEAWNTCTSNGPMERYPRKAPNPCKTISITSNDNVLVWKGYGCGHSADYWNGNPEKGIKGKGGNPWLENLQFGSNWQGGSKGVHARKL